MLLTILIILICIGNIQAQNNNSGSLGITILLGSGSIIGSGIYDIISAPKSAKIYNDNFVALNLRNQLHKKTPEKALKWSLAVSLIPITMGSILLATGHRNDNRTTLTAGIAGVSLGVLVGPNAGQKGRALKSTFLRVALAAAVFVLAVSQYEDD